MIALRACLRIPYAITFLAYAGDFSDMALREAYAGTFVTLTSVRTGNAYASLFSTCAKPYTSKLTIWTALRIFFFALITSSFVICLCPFRRLYFSFREHQCHTNPFRELSRRIFWKHMCLSIAHLHQSVLTPKACLGGIVGNRWQVVAWAYAGLTLTLRGPYADFTSTHGDGFCKWVMDSSWKLLHLIFNGSFLVLTLSDLTRETLRDILSNKKLTRPYAELSFPYAGRPYDKAPT